jgi:SSS family solute:Na+ symporter
VVILAQFLLFLLIGVGLWALQKHGLLRLPEGAGADQAFGWFIVSALPLGLRGLVVAAVLAAAMSTLSASLNSSATAFVVDFYRPLRPGRDETHYLRVSRVMTAVWGVAQVTVALVALTASPPKSVVDSVLTVAGWSSGIVLGLFVLGGFRRPVASSAALTGLVVGAAAVTAVFVTQALAWPWVALVGSLTTVTVALLVDRWTTKARP